MSLRAASPWYPGDLTMVIEARWRRAVAGYAAAIAAVGALTALGVIISGAVEPADVIMIYLLGVVAIAARFGRGPAAAAAVLSVASFDFFLVPPFFTLAFEDARYAITFTVMLGVGLATATLMDRLRATAEAARSREAQTATLLSLSRELALLRSSPAILACAERHIAATLNHPVTLTAEPNVAGAGALSLRVPGGPADEIEAPALRGSLEAMVGITAVALQSAAMAEEAQQSELRARTEELRGSLLSSVSHDLRTPLASITGAASVLLQGSASVDEQTQRELLQMIHEEAARLERLVRNLLEMTRLSAGAVRVHKEWVPIEEPIGSALARAEGRLRERPLTVAIAEGMPLVPLDVLLFEQLLLNLLENACRYTPEGAPIELRAATAANQAILEIADRGPGAPPGPREALFERFTRGRVGGGGVGLGLAICRAIAIAHGGAITAEDRPGGGMIFRVTLPLADAPPLPRSEEGA
ncbi:MAG: DUF4118 domain-containing protein [Nannocystis sp.]|nr:DUF4118 domain-containing protein [Nannocystis sp.]